MIASEKRFRAPCRVTRSIEQPRGKQAGPSSPEAFLNGPAPCRGYGREAGPTSRPKGTIMRLRAFFIALLFAPAGVAQEIPAGFARTPPAIFDYDFEHPGKVQLREIEIYQGSLAWKLRVPLDSYDDRVSGWLPLKPLIACKPMMLILRAAHLIERGAGIAITAIPADGGEPVKIPLYALAEGNRLAYKISVAHQREATDLCGENRDEIVEDTLDLRISGDDAVVDWRFTGDLSEQGIRVTLTETPEIEVVFIPVQDDTITEEELTDYGDRIKNLFPISHVRTKLGTSLGHDVNATDYDARSLLDEITTIQERDYPDSYVQGIYEFACSGESNKIDKCGLAYTPGKSSVSARYDTRCPTEDLRKYPSGYLPAVCDTVIHLHELGHNFGLQHPRDEEENPEYPYAAQAAGVSRAYLPNKNFVDLAFWIDVMGTSPRGRKSFLSDFHNRKAYLNLWINDPPASTGIIMR